MPGRLAAGIEVLDAGCGSGRAVMTMASLYPRSRFAGMDFSQEAIGAARHEAQRRGLGNVRFEVQDLAALEAERQYDLVTAFDVIHDQAQPAVVLRNIARALKEELPHDNLNYYYIAATSVPPRPVGHGGARHRGDSP